MGRPIGILLVLGRARGPGVRPSAPIPGVHGLCRRGPDLPGVNGQEGGRRKSAPGGIGVLAALTPGNPRFIRRSLLVLVSVSLAPLAPPSGGLAVDFRLKRFLSR